MLATLHRVGPLAGLTLALVATVGWIGLMGYVAIKLFETGLRRKSCGSGVNRHPNPLRASLDFRGEMMRSYGSLMLFTRYSNSPSRNGNLLMTV